MNFKDINLEDEYKTPRDNITRDFYIPLLEKTKLYQRSVGFFSSSSLIDLSYGLANLVKNNGKIQYIVSPVLSDEDIKAINDGYANREEIENRILLESFEEPKDYFEEERLNLLATLIANGVLDIKIAYSLNKDGKIGLFHPKLGLFYDEEGNCVAFSGSMNETKSAFNDNYESFDVFTSWNDPIRVSNKKRDFNLLWENEDGNALVYKFPEAPKNKLLSYKKSNVNWNIDDEEEIEKQLNKIDIDDEKITNEPRIPDLVLKDGGLRGYQKEAIKNWRENGYIGIYDMATGTGKTYTALGSIVDIYNNLQKKLAVVICCPQIHLVDQWVEDILAFNIKPIICHSKAPYDYKKKLKTEILDFNLGVEKFICMVCCNLTYKNDFIQEQIRNIDGDVLLVVDEAHNFGSSDLIKTLDDKFKYRLALSATFERYGDEYGTNFLTNYFQKKCIIFTLEQAIPKYLTRYKYYPILITLESDELEEYHNLSREISKNLKYDKQGRVIGLNKTGELLAGKRARLIAGAHGKITKLTSLMKNYQNDNHILVYCGATKVNEQDEDGNDLKQIQAITDIIGNQLNMDAAKFTSEENPKERAIIKEKFAYGKELQVLVAIKCLDEGVNIPAIKTAFILASTKNPKEYIQRRGRVLRKFPGKEFAEIYDFVTIPRNLEDAYCLTNEEIKAEKSLVKNELKRIAEFKSIAMNPKDSDELIEKITESYRLYEENDDIIELEDGSYE